MKDNNVLAWCGSAVTIFTGAIAQDIMQIVLLIIGILSGLFSLFVNIWVWYNKAKADGKITKEEVDELKDIVDKHTENKHDSH